MRWVHTADWHLGRIFHGVHLTDEQRHLTLQLGQLCVDAGADLLLVSGDIYDRAIPPPDAVALLDDLLCRLILEIQIPVVLISGNHDSPTRIGFAARVLRQQGLVAEGTATAAPSTLTLEDRHGPVDFHPLPYAEPALVGELFGESKPLTHDAAMALRLRHLRREPGRRAVLLAHDAMLGAEASDSERPLASGVIESIDPGRFAGFQYVAMGHLHRAQTVSPTINYAGSLFPYSFAEATQDKSVSLVEMDQDGVCQIERVHLAPRRRVRCVEGSMEELLARAADDPARDDYLKVSLLDREPVLDAMGRLCAAYPNVLHLERASPWPGRGRAGAPPPGAPERDDIGLFGAFYRQVTGEELSPAQAELFARELDLLREHERESA